MPGPGIDGIVALGDTEIPLRVDSMTLQPEHVVRISVHPPEFQTLVFRTGGLTVELQQQITSFVDALLDVCLLKHVICISYIRACDLYKLYTQPTYAWVPRAHGVPTRIIQLSVPLGSIRIL